MAVGCEESGAGTGKVRSLLIVVFASAWLLMIAAGWVLPDAGTSKGGAAGVLEGVRWTTGTWQKWDMFRIIPKQRGFEVELVGETESGEERRFGPLLPELEELDGRRKIRNHYVLARIIDDGGPFLDGYVQRAGEALHRRDPEIRRFGIRATSEATRLLERSREDGELWTTVPLELGPYPVTDD